jgi:hypothetical protein
MLGAVKIGAILSLLVMVAGLVLLNVGMIGLGALLGMACAVTFVSQSHIRATTLRRAPRGVCRACGYTHGLTEPGATCPECGGREGPSTPCPPND